ncbi:MAG: hypothetical protein E6G51_10980 [Actinobacteria bacterium]|nr:MAG: hypothetical protein E6G51_10980 [Actinomycetota bacterium]
MTDALMVRGEVDSQRVAERLAMGYLGSKLGATVEASPQSPYGPTGQMKMGDLGRGIYVPAPLTSQPPPQKQDKFLVKAFKAIRRQPRPTRGEVITVNPRASFGGAHLTAIYFKTMETQTRVHTRYEPSSRALMLAGKVPTMHISREVNQLMKAVASPLAAPRAVEIAQRATPERYVDDGLQHPPRAKGVTLKVRLKPLGPAIPPLVHDPDSE